LYSSAPSNLLGCFLGKSTSKTPLLTFAVIFDGIIS